MSSGPIHFLPNHPDPPGGPTLPLAYLETSHQPMLADPLLGSRKAAHGLMTRLRQDGRRAVKRTNDSGCSLEKLGS